MTDRIAPEPTATPTTPAATVMTLREYLSAEAWAEREFPARLTRGVPEIATDRTPVKCRGDALSPIWWRGKQWAVTEYGIERLDGTYVVAASRMVENIDEYPWPLHMGRKNWVDVDEFATAWTVALLLHGHAAKVTPDQVREVFAKLPPRSEDAA